MASPTNPKSHFHARSVSLPSKPNPLIPQAENYMRRISSSEAATTSSFSSVHRMISSLEDFYASVDDSLLLPHAQRALVQEGRDEVLESSLGLLDICSTGRDVVAQTKEAVQELQSMLRRRRGDELALRIEVRAYLASRKRAKKTIQNCLKNSKIKSTISSADQSGVTMVSMLREAQGVALKMIKSLLTLVHGKSTSCSFFSKWMRSNRVAADERASHSELEIVDAAIYALLSHKIGKASNIQTEHVQKVLAELESHIQDIEEEMECLIRRLIKTRVSLLNILNH
ncbi:uncharacterized protein LOC115735727 [Rhodamnia argentea]|uniref:Uncharacterized protein LOC115735727 n=1 Tax=Rhodamnia argentea TaxID=178133 RepID=A0A8B8NLH7_9MYRT|nr:uncharacterized protein LOC115735727 [Rhodamnia argentea]